MEAQAGAEPSDRKYKAKHYRLLRDRAFDRFCRKHL